MRPAIWIVSVARGPRTSIRIVFAGPEEAARKYYEHESERLRAGGVAKLFDDQARLVAKAGNLAR